MAEFVKLLAVCLIVCLSAGYAMARPKAPPEYIKNPYCFGSRLVKAALIDTRTNQGVIVQLWELEKRDDNGKVIRPAGWSKEYYYLEQENTDAWVTDTPLSYTFGKCLVYDGVFKRSTPDGQILEAPKITIGSINILNPAYEKWAEKYHVK